MFVSLSFFKPLLVNGFYEITPSPSPNQFDAFQWGVWNKSNFSKPHQNGQVCDSFCFVSFQQPKDLPFISAWEMASNPKFRVNGRDTLESLDAYLKKLQRRDKRLKLQTLPDFNHAMLFLE